MRALLLACVLAACGNDHAIEATVDAGSDPDPLQVTMTPEHNSLDDIHERIIAKRCSGQPGLCHNGQFEPNLATPAMTYAYLVNRPSIEKPDRLRVAPGSPQTSLFIDKLRNRNVATQMPLGAEPLPEADIADIEAWINAGALREPGAPPAPVLNNPPKRPEIAIYNASGTRLDGTGPVNVTIGTQLVLRHTVQDFETPDSAIPFAAVTLVASDGRNVVLNPGGDDPSIGVTSYDPAGPMGKGDKLDYKLAWTVPASLPIYDKPTQMTQMVPASGQNLTVLAIYVDTVTMGIAAFDVSPTPIHIQ